MDSSDDVDMSAFCRVCLQPPDKSQLLDLNLVYDEDEQLSYCECFTICTQIELRGEESIALRHPQNLCKSCGLELQMAYDFYKKVEDSKRNLRQLHERKRQQNQQEMEEQQELEEQASLIEQAKLQEEEDKSTTAATVTALAKIKEEPVVIEGMIVETLETTVECEGMEEHLDMEEYHTMEELDDEDAETIQIKIDLTKNDGESEEYTIETIALDEQQVEQLIEKYNYNDASSSGGEEANERATSEMSWQQAVVTVANESHLPLNCDDGDEKSLIALETSHNARIETEENETEVLRVTSTSKETMTQPIIETTERKRYTGKYSCDFCLKEFPNYSRMSIHRRMHELDRPKWTCADCGRLYATKQAMDVHIRSVHTKTGAYPCPICQKIYAIRKGLEIHMRYHNGDFPYVCDLCGKKFAQMSHLNTHKNVKHNSVRFCCEFRNCGKFFTSSASLRNHEFTHSQMPFECEFCQRGYPAKSKLKVHIKLKHGQIMTLDQMEHMRKFHVKRSKLNLIKVVECED